MPYSGPDAPPTAATSRCPTARSSSPGGVVGGQLGQELVDGPEPDDEVVAVVAVAEDGVEPGQVRGVALDDPTQRPSAARTAGASMEAGVPASARARVAVATARRRSSGVTVGRV